MSVISEKLKSMIKTVALAIGPEMLKEVAFVGGCTTCLLMTDEITKESVRYTNDVDLIIDIISYPNWIQFQEKLRNIGFTDPLDEDAPVCRMNFGDLMVDFMPIESNILGFSNQWYEEALSSAIDFQLDEEVSIKILTSPLFIATKFEAYLGRGNNDPVSSNDIEDIINLVDGRDELIEELRSADAIIIKYISQQMSVLLKNDQFEYTIASHTRNTGSGRADIIYDRIETIIKLRA